MKTIALLASFLVVSALVELTREELKKRQLAKETWGSAVAGKSVFVKFMTPDCKHCQDMRLSWDQLIEEFADSETAMVADVDCAGAGRSLCNEIGVRGYPTIKYGDPNNLEDYKDGNGRGFWTLKKFVDDNLGPICGPANLDLCDDAEKADIETWTEMSASELEDTIKETTDANEKFGMGLVGKASEKKEKYFAHVKESGLSLMKAVASHSKATKSEL